MRGMILAVKPSLLFLKSSPNLRFRFIIHHNSSCIPLQLQEFTSDASSSPPIKTSHVISRRYAPQVLDEMSHTEQQQSRCNLYSPDVFKIVQLVMEQPNATIAAMAHALAVKQGALSHLRAATTLLTVYSRCKELGSSSALFGEVVGRDVVFWNAMMSACIDNNCSEAAVCVFKKMVSEGNRFDATSLVAVVSAYTSLRASGKGEVPHGLSIKAGMATDIVLSNALIGMYAKCGDLSSSECVFWEVEIKDLITWNSIISGCFYSSRPERSLWYIKQMASCDVEPDSISISCALAACTTLQELDFGQAVHCWATKLGYAVNSYVSVSNSLVSFYAQVRDLSAAECVFREMTVKNVVSWNAMIKGFFLSEEAVGGAFCLIRDMQLVVLIQPDMATIVTLVPYCAELMLLEEGRAAHGFVIRRGMASEISVINSLINMYSKCSKIKEAVSLFSTMPKKDSVSWNTMIFGYAQEGLYGEAQTLFKKMLGCRSKFTLPALLAILPSCDSQDSIQFGRVIHGWSIKLGFLNQIFAVNSLIHMYISCGALSDAFALFGETSVKFDATSWNTVISGCSNKGHFWEALEYFELMRRQARVHCSPVTFGSVISACGNLRLVIEGKVVHGLALKTGASTDVRVQNSLVTMYGRLGDSDSARLAFNLSHDRNLCSWNCVISAMPQNEDAKKALELFRSLEFEPNEITISTILSACAQLGGMSDGKQIHGHVFRSNLHKNPYIAAALTDMYSNGGRLDIAEKVFLYSPEKSVTSWNSLISAYGFHNLGSKAVETFHNMIKSGVRPTSGSFTSLLSACSHAGLVDEGRTYYECMDSIFKVAPAAEHHVCMVDMLGRSGRLREARDFIKNLPTKAEAGVWGALLSACSYHGEIEMGREVAEILFSMEPDNGSYYVALCNMYVRAGKWEEAVELRSIMEDRQLKKQTGYSFIDKM